MSPKLKTLEKKIKILVVDDHPIIRQGLAQLIDQEEDLVFAGEAHDAAEALQVIEKIKPDLAIVDISLKGKSGIELTKDILSRHPKMLVLMISMHDEPLYVERAFRAGAKGYFIKNEEIDNVVTAIRKVLEGEIYVSEKMRNHLVHKFISGDAKTDGSVPQSLSDRELEVLQLVGQGLSTRQIADEVHISIKTVESHFANIKSKLDLKSSHELIQYAVKWCLPEK